MKINILFFMFFFFIFFLFLVMYALYIIKLVKAGKPFLFHLVLFLIFVVLLFLGLYLSGFFVWLFSVFVGYNTPLDNSLNIKEDVSSMKSPNVKLDNPLTEGYNFYLIVLGSIGVCVFFFGVLIYLVHNDYLVWDVPQGLNGGVLGNAGDAVVIHNYFEGVYDFNSFFVGPFMNFLGNINPGLEPAEATRLMFTNLNIPNLYNQGVLNDDNIYFLGRTLGNHLDLVGNVERFAQLVQEVLPQYLAFLAGAH